MMISLHKDAMTTPTRLYLFVVIERATRSVFVSIMAATTAAAALSLAQQNAGARHQGRAQVPPASSSNHPATFRDATAIRSTG